MARRGKYNRRRRSGDFAFIYKLLCFVLISGAIAFSLALFFKIETVEITGTSRYTDQDVLDHSGIKIGDNMFLLNKFRAAEDITTALPYIETVQIRRHIPTTLCIDVTECVAPAAIEQDGIVWLISGDGKVVDQVKHAALSNYTQITGVTLFEPTIGHTILLAEDSVSSQPTLLKLLELLSAKNMLGDMQALHLEDASVISMRYLDRFDITIEWDTDFDYKLDYLLAVVDRLEINETGTIDMTQEGKACFIPG